MNFATWTAIWAPRQEFQCFILNFSAFWFKRCTSSLQWSNIRFLYNHFKPDLSITLLSANRWRKRFHPHLPMLWKVSAQTQNTTSLWQPSLTKALEPSPMTFHRRPCKRVCSPLFSLPSCSLWGLTNNAVFPSKVVTWLYAFTEVNWWMRVCASSF